MSISTYGLNQHRFTLASGHITFAGEKFPGLQSMTPKDSVETTPIYGSGQIAVGTTRGPYKPEFSFEILVGEGDALMQVIGTPLSDRPFDVSGTFIENGSIDRDFTVQIHGCTWKSSEIGITNDQKALIYKVETTVILPISWNGTYLVDQPDGFDPNSLGLTLLSLF
jgi:hypothetical protein